MTTPAMALVVALAAPLFGPLKQGDVAPAVKAKNQDGDMVNLGALYGQRLVVVFFFPKAFTGG